MPALMHWIPSELCSELCFGKSSTGTGDLGSPRVALLLSRLGVRVMLPLKKSSVIDHSLLWNGLDHSSCFSVILLEVFLLVRCQKAFCSCGHLFYVTGHFCCYNMD